MQGCNPRFTTRTIVTFQKISVAIAGSSGIIMQEHTNPTKSRSIVINEYADNVWEV